MKRVLVNTMVTAMKPMKPMNQTAAKTCCR
jgi:hypothetical protein